MIALVQVSSIDPVKEPAKQSKMEITLKSATLPRPRKTSRAEITLSGFKAPETAFKSEVEAKIGHYPRKLRTLKSEIAFPVAAVVPPMNRSVSLENPQPSQSSKERIIPIQVRNSFILFVCYMNDCFENDFFSVDGSNRGSKEAIRSIITAKTTNVIVSAFDVAAIELPFSAVDGIGHRQRLGLDNRRSGTNQKESSRVHYSYSSRGWRVCDSTVRQCRTRGQKLNVTNVWQTQENELVTFGRKRG